MIANEQEHKNILLVAACDVELAKLSNARNIAEAPAELEAASAVTLQLSDQLIDARNAVGELEMELSRAESDLELVSNRIKKDRLLLSTTSSSKDAQGIEHELETLSTRSNELEDAQLQIMELLEVATAKHQNLKNEKSAADLTLAALESRIAKELQAIKSQAEAIRVDRSELLAAVSADLAAAYERKFSRGVAAGRLVGRDCGACRLAITATTYEELMNLPSDELAECPNCQAFLVRS